MSGSDLKDLRKQIKNVVKDLLPEILNKELTNEVYKHFSAELGMKLKVIDDGIKQSLKEMEDRQKTVYSMLVKEMSSKQQMRATDAPTLTEEK